MRISDWSSDVCSSDLPKNLAWRGRNDRVASFLPRTQRKGEYALRRGTGRIIAAPAPVRARIDASPKRRRRSVPGRDRARAEIARPMAIRNETRSEEHTSELQSLMRISYAVFCLKKKNNKK